MRSKNIRALIMGACLAGCYGKTKPTETPPPDNRVTYDQKACRYADSDGVSFFYATEMTNKTCEIHGTNEVKAAPGQLFLKAYQIVGVTETISYTVPTIEELVFPTDTPMKIPFETLEYEYLPDRNQVDIYDQNGSLIKSLTHPVCEDEKSKIGGGRSVDCTLDPYFNIQPQNAIVCFGENSEDFDPVFTGLENLNIDDLRKRYSSCTDIDEKEKHTPCIYKVDDSKKIFIDVRTIYHLKTTEERKARCREVYDLAKIKELTDIVRSLKPLTSPP